MSRKRGPVRYLYAGIAPEGATLPSGKGKGRMRVTVHQTMSRRRTTRGVAATAALLLALVAMSAPASAEPRRVLGFHFFADAVGFDIERESSGGGSWLAGLSLAPVGFYGGIRQYESGAADDRTFWTVYATVQSGGGRFSDELVPGLWASAGYEVRLDRSARGTGEIGFGLVGTDRGLAPRVFIGLALGWRLQS